MTEMSSTRKRLLAALFVVIVLAFVGVTVAIYNRAFTKSDTITMFTDDMAFSLPNDADVKARGVLVGRVAEVQPEGDKVRVDMEFTPEFMEEFKREFAPK